MMTKNNQMPKMIAIHINLNHMTGKNKESFISFIRKDEKPAYDEYLKHKDEIIKCEQEYKDKKAIIDRDKITLDDNKTIQPKFLKQLNSIKGYIPSRLWGYLIPGYKDGQTDDIKRQFDEAHMLLRVLNHSLEYKRLELVWWLEKEHPEMKEYFTIK